MSSIKTIGAEKITSRDVIAARVAAMDKGRAMRALASGAKGAARKALREKLEGALLPTAQQWAAQGRVPANAWVDLSDWLVSQSIAIQGESRRDCVMGLQALYSAHAAKWQAAMAAGLDYSVKRAEEFAAVALILSANGEPFSVAECHADIVGVAEAEAEATTDEAEATTDEAEA